MTFMPLDMGASDFLMAADAYISENGVLKKRLFKGTIGAGTKNSGSTVVVQEGVLCPGVHRTRHTLTNFSLAMVDATTAGSQGGSKLYTFPEGLIGFFGSITNCTIARVGTGLATTAAIVMSLGSVVAAVDNATLTTTEADMLPSTACTLSSGAGTFKGKSTAYVLYDGCATAMPMFINAAVVDAGSSGDDALLINGTIDQYWAWLGDV